MTGETDLDTLIRCMEPRRHGDYAFCLVDEPVLKRLDSAGIKPLALFREEEGTTAILELPTAQRLALLYDYVGTLITLHIHSSLDAVGFLARIAARLAGAGISVNAFSPIHHDHLFVRPADADKTIKLLKSMSEQAER